MKFIWTEYANDWDIVTDICNLKLKDLVNTVWRSSSEKSSKIDDRLLKNDYLYVTRPETVILLKKNRNKTNKGRKNLATWQLWTDSPLLPIICRAARAGSTSRKHELGHEPLSKRVRVERPNHPANQAGHQWFSEHQDYIDTELLSCTLPNSKALHGRIWIQAARRSPSPGEPRFVACKVTWGWRALHHVMLMRQ